MKIVIFIPHGDTLLQKTFEGKKMEVSTGGRYAIGWNDGKLLVIVDDVETAEFKDWLYWEKVEA